MAINPALFRPKQGGSSGGKEGAPLAGGVLILTLDDVLSRVPTRSLKPGLHDPTGELHFNMEELLDGISRGRATIMLSKLAERYPETFEAPAPGAEDTPIYLPLQKLIQQIGRATRRAPEKMVLPTAPAGPGNVPPPAPAAVATPAPADLPAELALPESTAVVAQVVPKPLAEEPPPAPKPMRKLRVTAEPVDILPQLVSPEPAVVAKAFEPSEPAKSVDAPVVPEAVFPNVVTLPKGDEPLKPVEAVKEVEAPLAVESAEAKEGTKGEEAPPIPRVEEPAPAPVKRSFFPFTSRAKAAAKPAEAVAVPPPDAEAAPVVQPPPLPAEPPAAPLPITATEVKALISSAGLAPPAPLVSAPAPLSAPEIPPLPMSPAPEASMRPPTGRPTVRPPSIQGPAGLVAPDMPPLSSPLVPGFVFAPKQAGPVSDFGKPPSPPEVDLPEVHMPPLFPVYPGPSGEARNPVPVPPSLIEPVQVPEPAVPPERATAETAGTPAVSEPLSNESAVIPPPSKAELVPDAPEPAMSPEAETPEPILFEPAPNVPVSVDAAPPEPPVTARPAVEAAAPPSSRNAPEPEPAQEPSPAPAPKEPGQRQISHAHRNEGLVRYDLFNAHFSLSRIDQEPLQAIFMTEEFLDLARVSQLSCSFPGITGCMIVAGDALAHSGERPAGFDAEGICQLTKQLSSVAVSHPEQLPAIQTYTFHIGNRALSIFARTHVSLCLVHSHRGFMPGVRERLSAVADTLSRGMTGEAEPG